MAPAVECGSSATLAHVFRRCLGAPPVERQRTELAWRYRLFSAAKRTGQSKPAKKLDHKLYLWEDAGNRVVVTQM